MRNLAEICPDGQVKDDKDVIFGDGILYIISISNGDPEELSIDRIILNAEYDKPLSLADIAEKYPNCHKLIFDDCLIGDIYNHGNHRGENDEAWELVGHTIGYV